ncbi:MAG: ABC transporter ATP-binding protein [Bacillota bacterium]
MEGPAVKVIKLVKKYGRNTVLRELEFEIDKGEIFGLFGPNGAGKTTFVSILAAISKPTSGDIIVNGFSVREQPDRVKADIGFVPQDIALYPMLSGKDNLDFWAGIYGLRGRLKKERMSEAISIVRLEDRIKDRVSEYSGGMKRRLNIAVSLMHHPKILVMDEPMAGVDVVSRKYILDALANLKNEGRTIVFTSHYSDELETLCDRIAIMDKGKIIKTGSADELKKTYGAASLAPVLFQLTEGCDP